jgi:two-component system chemotaxis response regulator CheB
MIKVLVVEDSVVVRELLVHILSSDPDLQVVGTARDGEEAVEMAERMKPDVITMDINMPGMDGFEATTVIMQRAPTPVIIVSASWDQKEVSKTFRALEAGALTALRKPVGVADPDYEKQAGELIQTVKLMSEVKVVKRWSRRKPPRNIPILPAQVGAQALESSVRIVAVGASTGGPPVLEQILSGLSKGFEVPILVVQHIAAGFIHGFADWLGTSSGFPVSIASHGEYPLPGHVYIAPDELHMGVGRDGLIFLKDDEKENGLRPAVSCLFRSVAETFGKNAVGVLLTGMGKDGALELKRMKDKGAVTIVQDKESSAIFGMPGEAINLGAATHVLPPAGIAEILNRLCGQERRSDQEGR